MLRRLLFFPGSMFLSLSMRLDLAAGVPAGGLDVGALAADAGAVAGAAGLVAWVAGCAACGLAPLAAGTSGCAAPGNGVDPSTTLAAESVGTDSLSFFTRIEILRLEGSVGLFFMRNIWSA